MANSGFVFSNSLRAEYSAERRALTGSSPGACTCARAGVCGLGIFSGGAADTGRGATLPFVKDVSCDALGTSAGLSFGALSGLMGVGVLADGVLACILARRRGLSLSLNASRSDTFAGSGLENIKLYSTPWATTRSLAGLTPGLLARRSLKAGEYNLVYAYYAYSKLNW